MSNNHNRGEKCAQLSAQEQRPASMINGTVEHDRQAGRSATA